MQLGIYSKIIGIIVFAIVLLIIATVVKKHVFNATTWIYKGGSELDKHNRESTRGIVASTMVSVVVPTVTLLMESTGVAHPTTLHTMVGLIWGNMVGFLLDNTIATDLALKTLREDGLNAAVKEAVSKLSTRTYSRFLMIDAIALVISVTALPRIAEFVNRAPLSLNGKARNAFSMFVLSITIFIAFTNSARFRWAYSEYNKENPLNMTFVLASALAATHFLSASNTKNGEGIESKGAGIIVFLAVLLLCSRETFFSSIDLRKNKTIGMLIYTVVCAVSFVTATSRRSWKTGALCAALAIVPLSAATNDEWIAHAIVGTVCVVCLNYVLVKKKLV